MATANLLIVEDEGIIAQDLQNRLTRMGYEVPRTAFTGREAIAMASDLRPDLVLMDIVLRGDMDGIEVAMKLRADFDIPIVFISAHADDSILERAKLAEPYGYILKPLHEEEVHSVIEISLYKAGMERKLRESETRYRTLVETAQEGVWILDAEGRTKFANGRLAEMFGYPIDEMLETSFLELVAEGDGSEAHGMMARCRLGLLERLDVQFRRSDGSDLWAIVSANPVFAPGGEYAGALAMVIDVTARRTNEERLRESHRQLEQLERLAHLGQWALEVARNELTWSDEHCRIYGLEPRNGPIPLLEGITAVHPADRPLISSLLERSIQEGLPYEQEIRIVRPDGETRIIDSRGTPQWGATGSVMQMIGTAQDITDRKNLEDQLRQAQKMEAIGVLAGGIAHDFNNLLTAIIGFGDLVLNTLTKEDPRYGYVQQIVGAGERASILTRQLLAFSRKQVLQPQVLNLNIVVGEMDQLLRRVIGEDIDLLTVLAADLLPVAADPGQLEQVILNLAINARDAMRSGGKLTIETANVDEESASIDEQGGSAAGPYAMLAITDNGHGIAPETLAHIFEPFFTTKPVGEGTGLGLSTVYGIVKQTGGHVSVYSEPGEGTTFKIYLPGAAERRLVPRPARIQMVLPTGSETVLLVEDEAAVRTLASTVLQSIGYSVLEATRGAEALEISLHHAHPIDLLLTDMVMPEMGGTEVAQVISARHTGVRVLYMSGFPGEATIHQRVLEMGARFLQKPFTPLSLARKVRETLDEVL